MEDFVLFGFHLIIGSVQDFDQFCNNFYLNPRRYGSTVEPQSSSRLVLSMEQIECPLIIFGGSGHILPQIGQIPGNNIALDNHYRMHTNRGKPFLGLLELLLNIKNNLGGPLTDPSPNLDNLHQPQGILEHSLIFSAVVCS